MNKTIKIIDLLNKIAKGEEVPKKVRYDDKVYEYKHIIQGTGYVTDAYDWFNSDVYIDSADDLNSHIEILEDNTEEIEELETVGYITTGGEKDIKDFVKKTNKVITDNFYLVNKIIEKQNKLVRAVNQIRKEKE